MTPKDIEPAAPHEVGVPEPEPDVEDVEPVRMVENDVRERLQREGFTEEQILKWVEAYFADHTEGSADEVIAWIRTQERESA
jgi:hypothetical protein